jgi:RIO kinase 1
VNRKNNFIDSWLKKYPDLKVIRDIKSGKEATVVLIETGGQLRCIKVYDRLSMATKADIAYLAGKWFKERSVRKSIAKGNKFSDDLLKKLWVKREYYLLKKLSRDGLNLPKVFDYNSNSIMMEYLGTVNLPAPLIKDIDFSVDLAKQTFDEIIQSIKIFLKNGIVHADLSEFNVLWWQDKPFIIDFPQAVDIRTNPNYKLLLWKDVNHLVTFFSKWISINEEKVLADIVSSSPTQVIN